MRCPECKAPQDQLAEACGSCGAILARAPVKARTARPTDAPPREARPLAPRGFFVGGKQAGASAEWCTRLVRSAG